MSCNFYNKLPKDQQPQLKPIQGYRAANGSPVQCLGKGMFKFKLGKLELKKALVVAAIVDDVLLGADILQKDPNGRARLLLDEERMILHGNSIPLTLLGKSESFRKVTAANNYIIQGMVEMTVDAYMEDFRDDSNNTAVLIEPSPQLGENLPLIMAPCLVDAVKNTTVTVRLINRSINPISINKDTVLGIASVCTEKSLPQFQKETSDQNRYFEKDEENTNRYTLPAEKDIIPLEEDLEITCEKCENKSEHMSSGLSSHDTENTIRRLPDHALEHKTKTSILKDYTSRSMRQISNIVQWLPKTTIVTTLFIIGIIFSYIRVIGNQISNKTQASVWTEGQTHPCVMRNCCRVETRSSAKTKQKEIDLQQENQPLKAPQKQPHKQKKFRDKPGWASNYSMVNLRKKQLDDPDISPILKWFESGKRPHGQEICASSPATRHFCNSWDMLKLHDGVLFRHFNTRNGICQYQQFLVPRSMKKEIIDEMHQCILSGGHLAKKKTRMKILQRFYWFGLRDDVNLYIEQCDNCGANKTPPKTPRAPLGEMRIGAPMDRLATDILGPLPTTPRGNRYVLIVTDYFSNWVEVLPIPDQTAETTAEVILNEVIGRYGCPLDIHSDQGPNYAGIMPPIRNQKNTIKC